MEKFVTSSDQQAIHYRISGAGPVSVIFVHGWLGNGAWWDQQADFFSGRYRVVQMDLAGHGGSGKTRTDWSSGSYAEDIRAVANQAGLGKIILVGHSMAGAYVLEASLRIPGTVGIVLVDTIKDLDQQFSHEEAEKLLFSAYRKDFRKALEEVLAPYLFTGSTPDKIRRRLQDEFLQNEPEHAIRVLEPLYKMDIRAIARQVEVPVRAINSDPGPTHVENNRKYFRDYDFVTLSGTGHYPMLERPEEFNRLLEAVLGELSACG